MAIRPPCALSTPAVSGVRDRSPSRTTVGTSRAMSCAIRSTVSCGTTTMIASGCISISWSNAASTDSGVVSAMVAIESR